MSKLRLILQEKCVPELSKKWSYFEQDQVKQCLFEYDVKYESNTLNKYLSELIKDEKLFDAGRGWYSRISKPFSLNTQAVEKLVIDLEEQFPLLDFSCWSTNQISKYLHHKLARFVSFVYVSRNAQMRVWEFLRQSDYDAFYGPVGRQPIGFVIRKKTIVVRPFTSKSPSNEHFSTIEKILVDLYREHHALGLMDTLELQNAVAQFVPKERISIATLISYANRCKINPGKIFQNVNSINSNFL
jgi:hypothetical protein